MMAGIFMMLSLTLAVATTDFARYQTIIDRSPFGQVQGAGGALAPNWLAAWHYVGTAVSYSGNGLVQAIIANKENNHWYFRAESELLDGGITVVKIDLTQNPPKLILKNGLETGTLTFPERAAVTAMAPAPSPASPAGLPGMPPAPAGASPTVRRIPFRRGN